MLPSIVAAAMGAYAVERHITYDKEAKGTDHACSLDLEDMIRLSGDLRRIDVIQGDGLKTVTDLEKEAAKKLRNF